MTRQPPYQSPKPLPTPLAMSAAEPKSSPIPQYPDTPDSPEVQSQKEIGIKSDKIDILRPNPRPAFPVPKLRLQIHDLSHPGASIFLNNYDASNAFAAAVDTVLSTLYLPTKTNTHIPGTRSVTLILEAMGGVAYTIGIELDNDHKEIHFSMDYIKDSVTEARRKQEIQGVLVHEMVHCWQWNARGTCPGGLIEGIADYVRLKAGLGPPHWKRPTKKKAKDGEPESDGRDDKWDAGYEKTAFFLEWLEENYDSARVRTINAALKDTEYDEFTFWTAITGQEIGDLWQQYVKTWPEEATRE